MLMHEEYPPQVPFEFRNSTHRISLGRPARQTRTFSALDSGMRCENLFGFRCWHALPKRRLQLFGVVCPVWRWKLLYGPGLFGAVCFFSALLVFQMCIAEKMRWTQRWKRLDKYIPAEVHTKKDKAGLSRYSAEVFLWFSFGFLVTCAFLAFPSFCRDPRFIEFVSFNHFCHFRFVTQASSIEFLVNLEPGCGSGAVDVGVLCGDTTSGAPRCLTVWTIWSLACLCRPRAERTQHVGAQTAPRRGDASTVCTCATRGGCRERKKNWLSARVPRVRQIQFT